MAQNELHGAPGCPLVLLCPEENQTPMRGAEHSVRILEVDAGHPYIDSKNAVAEITAFANCHSADFNQRFFTISVGSSRSRDREATARPFHR